tara:strand:+ start:359 stop:634 length:276 start_codon:yes stop_codon:yes gene_type:complete
MTSIQKSKNPKFKFINEWKEACPFDFNSRFIDVKKEIRDEIEHFNLKVTEEEIEKVLKAFMEGFWDQNSFILYLISEVQKSNSIKGEQTNA